MSLTCNHYKAVSDAADFGIFNSTGGGVIGSSATATLTPLEVGRRVVTASAPAMAGLLRAPTFFPVVPGTSGTTVIGGITYHTGLLLPCIPVPSGS